jgi:general secretion pathway protein C
MNLSPKAISRLATTLTLIMVIALGAQLAWWGWRFAKPSNTLVAANANNQIDLAQAQHLFGQAEVSATPAATTATAAPSDVRLKGVFAVDGKTPSAAVVNIGGRDMAVKLNEKISENITLVDVKADHIIISRAGARERIALERNAVATTASPPNASMAAANSAQGNFRLNVTSTARNSYALSRSELNTVLQDPRQINFLGTITNSASGGVQVQNANPGTLANKLGLQPGDLARLYGQFGTTNAIRAEIRRGGTPMLLTYSIGN